MNTEKSKRLTKKQTFWSSIKQEGKMDLTFFFLVTGLLVTGLIMLFSASAPYASHYYNNSYHFITRQLFFAIFGFVLMLLVSKINYHIFRRFVWIITGISIALLILVLVMPEVKAGFKRWIKTAYPSFVEKYPEVNVFHFLNMFRDEKHKF